MSARSLPLSAQELCESVRAGRALDAARLDRVLGVDAARGVVEVQSGARWKTLAARLRPDDEQTRDLSSMLYSIGRSVALNAAGPDGRPTVSHLESFTLVTPEGSLKRVDRINSPALFSLVVGGQGLFGALYSVRLRIDSLARAVAEARAPQTLVRSAAPKARKLVLLVPPAALESFIGECRERCTELRVALESLEVRPIHAEDETYLRWARREYAEVAVGLGSAGATLGAEVRQTQLRRGLIDQAIARGGGFAISCTPEATRAQTEACYPQLAGLSRGAAPRRPAGPLDNGVAAPPEKPSDAAVLRGTVFLMNYADE